MTEFTPAIRAIAGLLSPEQRAVMRSQNEEFGLYTTTIARREGFALDDIREAARELRDLGLVELKPCFDDEEYRPKGSAWFPRGELGRVVGDYIRDTDALAEARS